MKSGLFTTDNNTRTLSPIYMDQLSIAAYAFTNSHYHTAPGAPIHSGKKLSVTPLLDPVTNYFADPKLYPNDRANSLRVCGRKLSLTNGRRVTMADLGTPLAHANGKKRSPQEKTIAKFENTLNQFSTLEKSVLLENPLYAPLEPYKRQLSIAIAMTNDALSKAVIQVGLMDSNQQREISADQLERLELYIEFPIKLDAEGRIRDACERALIQSFGEASIKEHHIKNIEDGDELKPSFLKWAVHQKDFSAELNGKAVCYVKMYEKGDCIRLEFQANKPHRSKTRVEKAKQEISGRKLTLETEAPKIAAIIESGLRVIEAAIYKNFNQLHASPTEILQAKVLNRCRELFPRKRDSQALVLFAQYLSQYGAVDRKTFKSFGLDAQMLVVLEASNEIGFLIKRSRGISTGLTAKRNPIYVLDELFLSRKTLRQAKPLTTHSPQFRAGYHSATLYFVQLFASGAVGSDSQIFGIRQNTSPQQSKEITSGKFSRK